MVEALEIRGTGKVALELISVHKKLDEYNIEIEKLSVCDMNSHEFAFMCAQMCAQFEYSVETGPRVTEDFFDEKCLSACKLAKERHSELLLFPEYAISYTALTRIASDFQYQPQKGALWCLPCQGIPFCEIMEKVAQIEETGAIVIKDGMRCCWTI